MTTIHVYSGQEDDPQRVGVAYTIERRQRVSSTIAYDQDYLSSTAAFAIDPEFPLQSGSWPASHGLPGSFRDASPDRWGRNLINRRFPERHLSEVDYLLGVSDLTRQGALRFKIQPDAAFEFPDTKVPKLIQLPELLHAASIIDDKAHGQEAVKLLLDAGSGSLGGARPKAVVEKDGRLWLAKFPKRDDTADVSTAEYQALQEAGRRGLNVPNCELVDVARAQVLLVERFDRRYDGSSPLRVPYISAMTALGLTDGDQGDYLDIIDFLTRYGSHPKADIAELLGRIRYTIEINNTDDHLRNHGFLWDKGGWRLSPLFDINPNPISATPRQTALGGHTDAEGSLRTLEILERQLS